MEDLVTTREICVEGIGPWIWPIEDQGAWIGPSEEFSMIRDVIMPCVKERRLIVTAGGCCGMYPRLWAEIFETVYTVEPSPLNWYCLQKNCPSDNIKKFNVALGEHQQKNYLRIPDKSNVGTGSITDPSEHTIEIDMVSLDSFQLPYCDVIQLDIEGYEPAALLGAAETIQKFKPVISLETMNEADASHTLLAGWGYRIYGKARNDTIFVPI